MAINSSSSPLHALAHVQKSVVDPRSLANQLVDHYSIPAYDEHRQPVRTAAQSIRSNKQQLSGTVILVSKINPHIPRTWYVEAGTEVPSLASTEFICLSPRDGVEPEYLHAVCSSLRFSRELRRHVSGTSSSHQRVKVQDCLAVEVPEPTVAVQREIGQLVVNLDRKASAAARMCQLTTSVLVQLFRDMFPDCTAGGSPLADHVSVTSGVSYRSAELRESTQALVTLKCFGRGGTFRREGFKPWTGDPKPGQIVSAGDVVVAQTDLTQTGDVLGSAVMIPERGGYERLVASLDVAVVRPKDSLPPEFLFALLRQPEFRRHCRAQANGTTVLHLPKRAIPSFPIRIPPPASIDDFTSRARGLLARHVIAHKEVAIAASVRREVLLSAFGS